MSKKNNKDSETLSKIEKLFLLRFRRESLDQRNRVIELADFNLNVFTSSLEDNLNNKINTKISILNNFLQNLESNKNKNFEDFKNDLSSMVNNLFLLINIDDYVEKELNYIEKEMLKDSLDIIESDKAHLRYSDFNNRLKIILDEEITKLDKKFKKIIINTVELYKNEIIDIDIKNKKIIINDFLSTYLARLTECSSFIDKDNQELNILFKRSSTSDKKIFFELSQDNFAGSIDKKHLEKLSKDFNELITKNIAGDIGSTKYFNLRSEDGLKISKTEDENGNITYSGFESNFKNYSYKELNKLALEKGFVLDRCKGDHGIFIKKLRDEEKIIIIPQGRVVGKGLQATIIKSLNQY